MEEDSIPTNENNNRLSLNFIETVVSSVKKCDEKDTSSSDVSFPHFTFIFLVLQVPILACLSWNLLAKQKESYVGMAMIMSTLPALLRKRQLRIILLIDMLMPGACGI